MFNYFVLWCQTCRYKKKVNLFPIKEMVFFDVHKVVTLQIKNVVKLQSFCMCTDMH